MALNIMSVMVMILMMIVMMLTMMTMMRTMMAMMTRTMMMMMTGKKTMERRVVRRGVDPKGLLPSANARRPDLFDDRHGDDDDGDNDGE